MQETNLIEDEKPPETQEIISPKVKKVDIKDLEFVRLIDPIYIPSYLVEQIKDRKFPVERFYDYQKTACLLYAEKTFHLNPSNYLYALVHQKLKQVKGFLWMVVDGLSNSLVINNFSVDKEYWNKGESIQILEEKAKKMMKELKLDRVVWITKNAKFCENRGFKKSKETIMIYEE